MIGSALLRDCVSMFLPALAATSRVGVRVRIRPHSACVGIYRLVLRTADPQALLEALRARLPTVKVFEPDEFATLLGDHPSPVVRHGETHRTLSATPMGSCKVRSVL